MLTKENGSYLLDTNIVVALLRREKDILKKIEFIEIYVPSIVLGELIYGAERSQKVQENLEKIREFENLCSILNVDKSSASYYGRIKAKLIKQGKPLPENDIWIAALSLQYQIPLITRDSHFQEIEELTIISW